MNVHIPVAVGELIDKITILEIKDERIDDAAKKANVQRELALLRGVLNSEVPPSSELERLTVALRAVNERLWDIEDHIRDLERGKLFEDDFVATARSVYRSNDERARLKRQINEAVGSDLIEEKSSSDY